MYHHGLNVNQIYASFEKFHEETKGEREKYKTFDIFNQYILNSKGKAPLATVCKGLVVGNILLKNAMEQKHPYLVASSDMFIIIIPFGAIQSVIHLLAIPKVPMYNAVSLGTESILLLQKMQAALMRVITDILTPDSIAQKLYLTALSEGIDQKPSHVSNIRIVQSKNNFDTNNMRGAEACEILRGTLEDYYWAKKKNGFPLEDAVCTDLHLHNTNSVGQLHMHGWIAEPELITENGKKLKPKNTHLDLIVPVLAKFRGAELPKERKFTVVVKN